MKKHSTSSVRLTNDVLPKHYEIFITPDLENFTFEGEEKINITLKKSTSKITLHSAEIEILSAKFINGKKESEATVSYDDKAETATFAFERELSSGNGTLELIFTGILNDKMRGFYRSRYDVNKKKYHMGVTQFESTDARRAFPCFDEPAKKATFDVSLKVPTDRTVISNTIETDIAEHTGGYKIVKFAPTPKMSSYLLAFIIGHFEHLEKKSKDGVLVRVYVTPGKKDQAKFALDVATKVISFYSEYFGIKYPLPTMDLIAIPDFANGAMENWGAVTYRETALLVDDENSSLHNKQWVALVIAHELAHQWFGNLVTMEWWTHLWLNEGFASFMEYLAVDKLFPEWNIWTQFAFTERSKALQLDSLENTHAIEIPVHHPGEISEIFDLVSYSKGASIIKMLVDYMGEETFRKGLSAYLEKYKYSNAETEDLWRALGKVSGKPIGTIMKNWTSKPGYPLVEVNQKSKKIFISQKRFYSNPKAKRDMSAKWSIPIELVSNTSKKSALVLVDKKSISLPDLNNEKEWIQANCRGSSFVRVKYSDDNLRLLEKPIAEGDKRIPEEGRFGIVSDAFALAFAGEEETDDVLRLLLSYKNDESYILWSEIITRLLELNDLLYESREFDRFCTYSRVVLSEIFYKVGWDKKKNEPHTKTLLRSSLIYALSESLDVGVIEKAKKMFANSKKNNLIDSDIRGVVYAIAAKHGSKKEYDKFHSIYTGDYSEEEKDRALRAMCSFTNKKYIKETLALAFSENVRAQDSYKAVYLMSINPEGIDLAWDYVKENWAEIKVRFAGGHLFSRFISPFSRFKTEARARELEDFFKKNKAEGITRTVAQTLERIRTNIELLSRDREGIRVFLKDF